MLFATGYMGNVKGPGAVGCRFETAKGTWVCDRTRSNPLVPHSRISIMPCRHCKVFAASGQANSWSCLLSQPSDSSPYQLTCDRVVEAELGPFCGFDRRMRPQQHQLRPGGMSCPVACVWKCCAGAPRPRSPPEACCSSCMGPGMGPGAGR